MSEGRLFLDVKTSLSSEPELFYSLDLTGSFIFKNTITTFKGKEEYQSFNLTDCNLMKSPRLLNQTSYHMFCVITGLIELEFPFCLVMTFNT